MADATFTPPAPRRRRRWLRVLGWALGVFLVLILALYFVVTSAGFLKRVVLPRVGKALNASITVSDASISPFSRVVLKGLKVQTSGAEPLVECDEVRLRYSLTDILRGNMDVDEVAMVSPKVVLLENPDGTSNLDPILKSQQPKPKEQKPAVPSQPAKPLRIDLKQLSITGAILRQVKLYPSGTRDVNEWRRNQMLQVRQSDRIAVQDKLV